MSPEFEYDWFEDLPENCPPNGAEIPRGETYYRIVNSFPPRIEDFYSWRKLFPNKTHSNECIARAVSLRSSGAKCKKLLKLTRLKGKIVVKIELDETSGVVLKTGSHKTHYSWWMSLNFNPISKCGLT